MNLPSGRAYHVIYDPSLSDALEYASKNNWTGVVPDIGVPRFSPELISQQEREELKELSSKLNIEWGFHAPGDDISLFSTYGPIRQAILDYFKKIIDFARDVSTDSANMVIHAGAPPKFRKAGESKDAFTDENLETFESVFFENILTLIEYGSPDVKIVMENYKWDSIIRHAIPSLISRGLKLCLDIPKLYNSEGVLERSDWMIFQQYSDAIEVAHVHDSIPEMGSHQIVGKGVYRFRSDIEIPKKSKSCYTVCFRSATKEAATESLDVFSTLYSKESP